ncbi:hypothetical protein AGLY_012266 [Aphis glycines]|uniref:Uncharacterized protein n=1 Tax=Aphis glycines TaxID=307491 RepID=A0A6G0TAX6_APHGL|nr:hypothetical protein AGLY_012266 [Aphis glycines]
MIEIRYMVKSSSIEIPLTLTFGENFKYFQNYIHGYYCIEQLLAVSPVSVKNISNFEFTHLSSNDKECSNIPNIGIFTSDPKNIDLNGSFDEFCKDDDTFPDRLKHTVINPKGGLRWQIEYPWFTIEVKTFREQIYQNRENLQVKVVIEKTRFYNNIECFCQNIGKGQEREPYPAWEKNILKLGHTLIFRGHSILALVISNNTTLTGKNVMVTKCLTPLLQMITTNNNFTPNKRNYFKFIYEQFWIKKKCKAYVFINTQHRKT